MKNFTKTFAIIFFIASAFTTSAMGPGSGSSSDNDEDSHLLNINIPTHAMVSIAGSNSTTIDFSAVSPELAGNNVSFEQESEKKLYLNYSSIVSSGNTNSIDAKVSNLPDGLKINLNISSSVNGGAKGQTGTGHSVSLDTDGKTVVSEIGSCYTGNGVGKGHTLDYSVEVDESNYHLLVATEHHITVTYTISGD